MIILIALAMGNKTKNQQVLTRSIMVKLYKRTRFGKTVLNKHSKLSNFIYKKARQNLSSRLASVLPLIILSNLFNIRYTIEKIL